MITRGLTNEDMKQVGRGTENLVDAVTSLTTGVSPSTIKDWLHDMPQRWGQAAMGELDDEGRVKKSKAGDRRRKTKASESSVEKRRRAVERRLKARRNRGR